MIVLNKKGFTLVEILAVVVILSLLIVITATKGFGVFYNSKDKITEQNNNALKESANVLAEEVRTCDDDLDSDVMTDELANLNGITNKTCYNFKQKMTKNNGCLKVTSGYLKTNNYIEGNDIKDLSDDINYYLCLDDNTIEILDEEPTIVKTTETTTSSATTSTTSPTTSTTTTTTTTTTTVPVDPCRDIEFGKSTLAYKLVCDAKSNNASTSLATYRDTPLTIPGESVSQRYLNQPITSEKIVYTVSNSYKDYYVTYGTGFKIDTTTGIFTLTNARTCKYSNNCIQEAINKYGAVYLKSLTGYQSDQLDTSSKMYLYKVIKADIPVESENYNMEYYKLDSSPYSYESTLSKTEDIYGNSYYYRGGVVNNYLNFAGMCWRIVRIQGNGAIKLVLEDKDQLCENSTGNFIIGSYKYGVDQSKKNKFGNYYRKLIFINNNSETNTIDKGFENFQTTKLSNVLKKLDYGSWCFDNSGFSDQSGTNRLTSFTDSYYNGTNIYYGANTRIATKKPSLKCNVSYTTKYYDNKYMYVGTLTADEIIYAGGRFQKGNTTYYLYNGINDWWWTLSPHVFTDKENGEDHIYHVSPSAGITCIGCSIIYYGNVRPAIILKANTSYLKGNGTKSNPYNVN